MDIKPLLIIITLVAIFALEGVFPHYQNRTARLRHGLPHVVTAIMNGLFTRFALGGMTVAALAWAQTSAPVSLALFQPVSIVEIAFVFVLFDIYMYFWHKANHRIAFLWRFHRAHHSDTDMDTTTALRFHPGELVLSTLVRLPVLMLLGMTVPQLILFETILNLSTLFHHSNLAVPEKWDRVLRMVITTPNMHRVHHSVVLAETNSNYTSILSFWDRLFNTFRTREDTRTITLGLEYYREENFQRLWGFLKTPFL